MKIGGTANSQWLAIKNARLEPQAFWGYEDIGAFLLAVLLGLIFRLLVRFQLLPQFAIVNPSVALQSGVVALLGAGLYFILRLRYRQPVLKPLGWIVPQMHYVVMALMAGAIVCGWHCTLSAASQPGPTDHSNQRVANPRVRL